MNENRFFTQDEKRFMLDRQEYMCGECGDDLWGEHIGANEAHHILPVWAGGTTEIENGVVLCPSCHAMWDRLSVVGYFYPEFQDIEQFQDDQIGNPEKYKRAYNSIALNRKKQHLQYLIR